jgi:hypothetical protein
MKRKLVSLTDPIHQGELADRCMVNISLICQAVQELGKKATEDAVCRRALELLDENAKKARKRWR